MRPISKVFILSCVSMLISCLVYADDPSHQSDPSPAVQDRPTDSSRSKSDIDIGLTFEQNSTKKLQQAGKRAKKRLPKLAEMPKKKLPSCVVKYEKRIDEKGKWLEEPYEKTEWDLSKTASGANAVLNLMAATELGRDVLKLFLPRLVKKEISILQINEEVRQKYGVSDDAEAFYQVEDGILFSDLNNPAGQLAPEMFHEIIHATDEDMHRETFLSGKVMREFSVEVKALDKKAAERLKKPIEDLKEEDFNDEEKKAQKRIVRKVMDYHNRSKFKTERIAYRLEMLFMEEMAKLAPCADEFVDTLYENGMLGAVTSEDIIEAYELDRRSIYRFILQEKKRQAKRKAKRKLDKKQNNKPHSP